MSSSDAAAASEAHGRSPAYAMGSPPPPPPPLPVKTLAVCLIVIHEVPLEEVWQLWASHQARLHAVRENTVVAHTCPAIHFVILYLCVSVCLSV